MKRTGTEVREVSREGFTTREKTRNSRAVKRTGTEAREVSREGLTTRERPETHEL